MSTSGRWPILLSGRAVKELRQLSKDKRTLEIVQKKLKELSHGQFTSDNHLTIRGTSENIPVYRARLSNDLRMIYQIDVVPDGQNQNDHQIIKVFSIISRARVDYNFWVKVSKYLARQGSGYRNRCIQTAVSPNSGATCVPSIFPHQEYELFTAGNDDAVDEIDLDELHEAVALERFTPVTKQLYKAILADLEDALPMALNADERAIVRHHGTSVVIGRSGTGKTTALIYKIRANDQLSAMSGDETPVRQLFVTRSKVLTQYVATNYQGLVKSSEVANKTDEELAEIRRHSEKYWQRELVEFDNEIDSRKGLPERFSQLQDSDFPLFLHFDKLCSLLEADLFGDELDVLTSEQPNVITFKDFKHKYWPQFDSKLTRNLDPGLVYSEILGVIKGCGDNLTKEEYTSGLSHKKSPLLLDARGQVYAIFEAYVRQSRTWDEIDTADRTRKILHKYSKSPRWQVDYLFVDEVQDHLMVDVHLLQSLCSNPDGSYWGGDTAQTINVGSSFRIKDLKTSIYEKMCSDQTNLSRQYRKTAAPFPTFELTVNFRSHGGIVRYAASIVELIYTLFPNAIDHMDPETAKVPGRAPLLFVGSTHDESEFINYLLDGKPLNEATQFGAQQAIIVRSESTAQLLATRLRNRCTVVTLLETKGLEFNDIIIYNFFSESEASTSTWRSLLALSSRNEGGRIRYNKCGSLPSISPVLCSELKQLYVAVTRARHRCWLWDSGGTINLMKLFWSTHGLITVSDSLQVLGSFATPPKDLSEWSRRGREHFSNGLYALATSCFECAGQDREAAISHAYHRMLEAKQLQADKNTIEAAHLSAANEMEACATTEPSRSASTLWYHTATCFEAAGKISRASMSYRMGGFYDRAALTSFNAQDIEDCLLTLLPHYDQMEASLAERITQACKVHALRTCSYGLLQELFKGDLGACIEYARELRFSAPLKDMLKMSGRIMDLADVYMDEGSPVEAVRCLLQSPQVPHLELVQEIVLTHLRSNFGLDATPAKDAPDQATELIQLYLSSVNSLDISVRQEIMLFTLIAKQTPVRLSQIEDILGGQGKTHSPNRLCMMLGYHYALKENDWASADLSASTLQHFRAWRIYSSLIQEIVSMTSPVQDKFVQRILGLSIPTAPRSSNAFHIPDSSTLYAAARKGRMRVTKTPRRENIVAANDVNRLIKQDLAEQLKTRHMGLRMALFKLNWSQPSWSTTPSGITFNDQLQALAFTFAELGPMSDHNVRHLSRRNNGAIGSLWLTRLFNLTFSLDGSCNDLLALNRLHRGGKSKEIICTWILETLKALDPVGHHESYITTLVICLSLAFELQIPGPHHEIAAAPLQSPSLLADSYSAWSESLTADLVQFFQCDSPRRITATILALYRIIRGNLAIDGAILVHLLERIAREIILAERVKVSRNGAGFSGLIITSSWARSLAIQSRYPQSVLETGTLAKLLKCIEHVLRELYSGLPDHWRLLVKPPLKDFRRSLITRLHWSLALVAVNLHPAHQELRTIFSILQQARSVPERRGLYDATRSPGSVFERNFAEISNQQSSLLALYQTIRHEELVMLTESTDPICPDKRGMVHKIIEFRDLANLHFQLSGFLLEPAEFPVAFQATLPSRNIMFKAVSVSEGTKIIIDQYDRSEHEAASRIQLFWRKYLAKQHLRHESNFDKEGACYEQFRRLFLPLANRRGNRDRLLLWILRGPCLSIIVALQSLVQELEEFLDSLYSRLRALNLDPKDIAKLQKGIKRDQQLAQGFKDEAENLARRVSTEWPPTDIKIKNLMHAKILARDARELFNETRNSKLLHGNEAFEEADQLTLYAKNVILGPSKSINRPPPLIDPPQLTSRPVQLTSQPVQLISQPVQLATRPPQFINRSSQFINRPPQSINRPPQVLDQPPQVPDQPPQVIDQPPEPVNQPASDFCSYM